MTAETLANVEATYVTIYALRDPLSMEIRYVGRSLFPQRRFQAHLAPANLNRYKTKKNSWLKGLLAAGAKPHFETVDEVPLGQDAAAEQYWIAWYRSQGTKLTNGTDGGDGCMGLSPEARARITAAHRGTKASAETRALMSASAKKRITPQERERLRSIATVKPPVMPGETNPRAKLSDAQVRQLRELAAAGKALRSLAAEYGITPASVTQLVTGQTRRAAGGPTRKPKQRSVLNEQDVAEIRRLAAEGAKQADICRRFGVSQSYVSEICSQKRRRERPSHGGN